VEALVREAEREGVTLRTSFKVASLIERRGRVAGVRADDGSEVSADEVVVAAGAWTGKLLPELSGSIRATGHPVFHLRPSDPEPFAPERFPVFTADVARTGYYGFPLNREGVVKVVNHGPGTPIDPDAERGPTRRDEEELRSFLDEAFPALLDAPIVFTRLCLYADTQDEDFWIARDPNRAGLTVAGGGSGHGLKFGPVLGALVADAVEGVANEWLDKFRWRPELFLDQGREAARCHTRDEGGR
jgi:glycine/D-amino acid oxidase-like deaminating enzyme